MENWATAEFSTLDLGDPRRTARVANITECFTRSPAESIPSACRTRAQTKAVYRACDSEFMDPQAILAAHGDATLKRAEGLKVLLVAQDTTSLDFTTHKNTKGLGPLDHPKHNGLLVHTGLALNEEGVPLGVLSQKVWTRDPKKIGKLKDRLRREIREKESVRWLETVKEVEQKVPSTTCTVVIGDREADFYDLFAMGRAPHVDLLVRAWHDRTVLPVIEEDQETEELQTGQATKIWECARSSPEQGRYVLEINTPASNGKPAVHRTATITLRFMQVGLTYPKKKPKLGRTAKELAPIPVSVVLAEEVDPPSDQEKLSWLLMTTLHIKTVEDARRAVYWYTQRWKVERFHFTLKSGCLIEKLQLETRERLERALAIYSVVAARLLWLTHLARTTPEASCTEAFKDIEWKALWIHIHDTKPPAKPPTIREAVRWTAQMGGFLARKGDGEPGVKVLWRGLRRLDDYVEGMKAALRLLGNG